MSAEFYREHPKAALRLWRNVMSQFWQESKSDWYEDVILHVLTYGNILRNYAVQPRGVLYVGANTGQLLWVWVLLGFRHVLMVEPQEKEFARLESFTRFSSGVLLLYEQFTGCTTPTQIHVARCAIGDREGEAELHVTSNSNLSSLLEPDAEALRQQVASVHGARGDEERPETVARARVPVKTLDGLLAELHGPAAKSPYNALYLNIQGGELKALEGAPETLAKLDFVYLENNFVERYKGAPRAEDIDRFLAGHGFTAAWGQKYSDIGTGFTAYVKQRS